MSAPVPKPAIWRIVQGASPVHRRVRAPREGVTPGQADLLPRRVGDVLGRIDALYRQPRATEVFRPLLWHAFQEASQFVAFPISHIVFYLPDDTLLDQAGKFLAA